MLSVARGSYAPPQITDALRALPGEQRAAWVTSLGGWARTYTASEDFQKRYKKAYKDWKKSQGGGGGGFGLGSLKKKAEDAATKAAEEQVTGKKDSKDDRWTMDEDPDATIKRLVLRLPRDDEGRRLRREARGPPVRERGARSEAGRVRRCATAPGRAGHGCRARGGDGLAGRPREGRAGEEVTLRPITAADLRAVHALERRIEVHEARPLVTPYEEIAEWLTDPFLDLARDTRLVEHDGRVIAWGRVWCRDDREREARAFLFGGVDPDRRREGIGGELLAWLIASATERLLWPRRIAALRARHRLRHAGRRARAPRPPRAGSGALQRRAGARPGHAPRSDAEPGDRYRPVGRGPIRGGRASPRTRPSPTTGDLRRAMRSGGARSSRSMARGSTSRSSRSTAIASSACRATESARRTKPSPDGATAGSATSASCARTAGGGSPRRSSPPRSRPSAAPA